MATVKNTESLPHLEAYIDQLPTPETLEDAIAQRDGWVESAMMFSRNEDYYRGLLDRIAQAIGVEAFTADDGSVYDSPIRAKVPELVEAILGPGLSLTAEDRADRAERLVERLRKALEEVTAELAEFADITINGQADERMTGMVERARAALKDNT